MRRARGLFKGEVLVAIFIFLVSGLVFYLSRGYPELGLSGGGSPAFYPRVLAIVFTILAVLLMFKAWRRKTTSRLLLMEKKKVLSSLSILLLLLVTPYLLRILGFLLYTFLVLVVSMLILKGSSLTVPSVLLTILLSVGITGITYAAFWWGVRIPLPTGILFGG